MLRCCSFLALAALGVLWSAPKLSIEQAFFQQFEDGPPQAIDYRYNPGETVHFSFHIAGFARSSDDQVRILYRILVRDPQGVDVVKPIEGHLDTTLSPEDKHWTPIVRDNFALPPLAAAGVYQVFLSAKDEIGGAGAETAMSFQVAGDTVVPSNTLTVRNFRFLRSESAPQPVETPAYRPGDTVWAKFDMTGYKFGENNRFEIGYGIQVLTPDGKVNYSQPEAATATNQSFYPQRSTPAELSVVLPKDLPTGEYTLVLTVHDKIGGQTYETRQKFSVE